MLQESVHNFIRFYEDCIVASLWRVIFALPSLYALFAKVPHTPENEAVNQRKLHKLSCYAVMLEENSSTFVLV